MTGIGRFAVARDPDTEPRRVRLPEHVLIGDVADDEERRGDFRAEHRRRREQLERFEDLVGHVLFDLS